MPLSRLIAASIAALVQFTVCGADVQTPSDATLDAVRRSYVELRRDALVADPAALLPAATAVAVYVSIDPRTQATLDGVSLQINGELVREQRYSDVQVGALRRGAMNRLFVGALPPGISTLVATFQGTRRDGKPYSQSAHLELAAAQVPQYVQLELGHTTTKGAPDIVTDAWPPR
jgi:hypothetical protein